LEWSNHSVNRLVSHWRYQKSHLNWPFWQYQIALLNV
jgi:hypothetical protein